MSAVLNRQASAAQPGLPGIADAPQVDEVRFSMFGQIERMAEVRISPSGEHVHLVVRIVQPPHHGHSRIPIVCSYRGTRDEIPMLQRLAEQLHVGAHALVLCRGIDFDHERHELRAWRCDRVAYIPPAEASTWATDSQLAQSEDA